MEPNQTSSSQMTFISILGVAILLVAVIGVSFAVFTYTGTGTKTNTITTGTITMSYTEPTNGISITNMMPTTDATGKALASGTNVFDFTVAATMGGSATINWAIGAEKVSTSTLANNEVKLYLDDITSTTTSQVLGPTNFTPTSSADATTGLPSGQMKLASGTFTATTTKKYRLKMWVADSYVPTATAKSFSVKVHVYGKAAAK